MKLGDKIKALREAKGWTQVELAQRSGVSQQTIGKIEVNGSREPKTLPRIAAALGESVESILGSISGPAGQPRKVVTLKREKPSANRQRWPFQFPFDRYDRLDAEDKAEIESRVWGMILKIEARRPTKTKRVVGGNR